ncbi:MAG: hypothetical protein QOD81_2282, partial [Solirubrobacteraceae bacterium]|nr:hypothetical protein [Solirubrobacteraceae bacterium]
RRSARTRCSPRLDHAPGAFALVPILAGIGAAVLPARRASRLNVLDALQYE